MEELIQPILLYARTWSNIFAGYMLDSDSSFSNNKKKNRSSRADIIYDPCLDSD